VTSIEWTRSDDGTEGKTWNPTTGCDRISPGCDNCYALTMAKRLKGMGSAKYQNDGDPRTSGPGFGITAHRDALEAPLSWKKPRRVFVNSMSDLFHARVPVEFITDVWRVMEMTPQHTFQVLTKRPERLAQVLAKVYWVLGRTEPLPNVWLGTSVENQKYADLRIPALLTAPAAVRFLSMEPLLGPVDLWGPIVPGRGRPKLTYWLDGRPGWGPDQTDDRGRVFQEMAVGPRLDWVIVGGESGSGARPMDPAWAAGLVEQCQQSGTAVFVKQLGSVWARDTAWGGKTVAGHGDTKGGNPGYWPTSLRVREYPTGAAR
jgi:protein gp37